MTLKRFQFKMNRVMMTSQIISVFKHDIAQVASEFSESRVFLLEMIPNLGFTTECVVAILTRVFVVFV